MTTTERYTEKNRALARFFCSAIPPEVEWLESASSGHSLSHFHDCITEKIWSFGRAVAPTIEGSTLFARRSALTQISASTQYTVASSPE